MAEKLSPLARPSVLLATSNEHKLREIRAILHAASFRLVSLHEFPGVALPPETGDTFEENAILKAVAAAHAAGIVAIGDDSGIEADALAGRPGIRSARYAGPGATDKQNLELLLHEMKDVPVERRQARFVCAIAVATPEGDVKVVRRTCEGVITRAPQGQRGFGYDPVFLIPGDGRTLAEFAPEEKDAISHRGQAVRAAASLIESALQHTR